MAELGRQDEMFQNELRYMNWTAVRDFLLCSTLNGIVSRFSQTSHGELMVIMVMTMLISARL